MADLEQRVADLEAQLRALATFIGLLAGDYEEGERMDPEIRKKLRATRLKILEDLGIELGVIEPGQRR